MAKNVELPDGYGLQHNGDETIYSKIQDDVNVPKMRIIEKKVEEIELIGDIDVDRWQESPSRILYHNGLYHIWIWDTTHVPKIDWDYGDITGWSSNATYLTSEDTINWTVQGHLDPGAKGCYDDLCRWVPQVVKFEGRFYMFYTGLTTNVEKYGNQRAGIGLLTAEKPEGPWVYAVGDQPIIQPSMTKGDWDYAFIDNALPIYYQGKWFVYYKATHEAGKPTNNGVAIADKITGPYIKYENNPICKGHGHFPWVYRNGVAIIPQHEGEIHWSPDGIHFANVYKSYDKVLETPVLGAFYLPNDPLSGDVITNEESDTLWGIETRLTRILPVSDRRFDIYKSTITFEKNE